MRVSIVAAALAVALTNAASAADTMTTAPAPKPPSFAIVRGTIQSFDGKTLSIKTTTATVTAPVGPNMRYAAVEARTFEQLKPTDFVGITAVDGPNGHLVAEEIHVLPGVMGEGQYPWDHHPEAGSQATMRAGSMTNGTVQPTSSRGGMSNMSSMTNGTVSTGANHQLTVTFHGSQLENGKCVGHAPPAGTTGCVGTAIADVTAKTFIQAVVPAKADDVKAGLAVVAFGLAAPDGSVTAFGSATVEKNGVKPEM